MAALSSKSSIALLSHRLGQTIAITPHDHEFIPTPTFLFYDHGLLQKSAVGP
jgi:hypothetical protein